ncbi:MAG: DUF3048 domain-containing protein [bacterium]
MRKIVIGILTCLTLLLLLSGCGSHTAPTQIEEPPPAPEEPPPEPALPDLPGAVFVSVENHPNARPQSGLDKADLVIEMDSEAGITRFLALYYSEAAGEIGPVRSARSYFVQIVKAFDSPFAHAGGSEEALLLLKTLKIKNLDEIYGSGAYFWRSRNRKMPHNLYTSTDLLVQGAEKKGYKLLPYSPLPEGTPTGGAETSALSLKYANNKYYKYITEYRYDGNLYAKYVNGEPLLDSGGSQIAAANVIVIVAQSKWLGNQDPPLTDIKIVGSGPAYYFTQGKIFTGEWKKAAPGAHFQFTAGGETMQFSPGKTWINVIPSESALDYITETK